MFVCIFVYCFTATTSLCGSAWGDVKNPSFTNNVL